MSLSRFQYRGASLSLIAAALLSACSGQSNSLVPSQGMMARSLSALQPDAGPAKCVGQKTTKNYASINTTFSSKGGTLCIPAFGGFGGSVTYPGATPPIAVTVISSTTNYNKMPMLGTGKPIFYLQVGIKKPTKFGTKVAAGGGLVSKSFVPGQTYYAVAGASVEGLVQNLGACSVVATKSSAGGSISGFGTLLKGQPILIAPVTGVVEIYAVKQTVKGKC